MGDKVEIEGKNSREMPHYRSLKISSSNGEELYIMPDAGLAYGWKLDIKNAEKYYDCETTAITDDVPIYMCVDEILFYIERASRKNE